MERRGTEEDKGKSKRFKDLMITQKRRIGYTRERATKKKSGWQRKR